jgi:3',5'-cyclic AMP phosphodiesterase CpdA
MHRLHVMVIALLAAFSTVGTLHANDRPRALVLEHIDQWTHSARAMELLDEAGFEVAPLPLDASPADLEAELILFGSFASEHPGYAAYMKRYAEDLRAFTASGRTIVQLAQGDQVELAPPFAPATLSAVRCDRDYGAAVVLAPDHPLLKDAPITNGKIAFHATRTVWESFNDQSGYGVLLAADAHAQTPALMEGAVGRGRIILAAMTFDKTITPVEQSSDALRAVQDAFAKTFFSNLAAYVAEIAAGRARPVDVTPSPLKALAHTPGSWTLAVLPDTQVYAMRHPGLFYAQTGWIAKNRDRLDIRYVLQLGDVVNNNTPKQWRHARDAMSLLDGEVPYAIAPGNHDYGPNGNASTRDTLFNDYFPFEEIAAWPTFGGAMEEGRLDNTYHLFDAGGAQWIIIALEWAPRLETIAWANDVMERHPDRIGIMITHAYMNSNERRYDHTDTEHSQTYNPHGYATPGAKSDGEELWNGLVRRHDFLLVLNGHVLGDGTGYLVSTNDAGDPCHQMLANYQMRTLGGEAYMRLLEFQPDGRTIQVKTYSPLYDGYLLEPDQQFRIELETARWKAVTKKMRGREHRKANKDT